jgi:hypothetical protein
LADSTGQNYVLETRDSQDRISKYFMKAFDKMHWRLFREAASAGGTTSFTTPKEIEVKVENTQAHSMIFTNNQDLMEVRVLTDSVAHHSIVVVSSKVMEATSKCGIRTPNPSP